ncbi:hypothetical protein M8542_36130 [Amycolatopsis sp. OK19-0408]|uniref:Secreted protein/lipoprotein n=1 Tax=Amycolatopsis iheyensis TaxID=2945988 RepID=A0A9X2SNR4_9PSEU|nr:hypothetical protein [Amycolatopsis iheyensis]MCR6488273.1 hypothetical protein [Amycolatopsis iheyensis]
MITLPAILPVRTVIPLARTQHASNRWRLGVGAVAVLGFAVSACSSGGADVPASSASTPAAVVPTATTASPASTAKQKAVDAYLGMWRDVAAVAITSDWRSPRLAEHATGDALSVLSRQLYADHYNGVVSKGAPVNSPVAQSVDSPYEPKTVVIRDCSDASTWLKYRADNGKPADDKPGGKHLIDAEVKLAVDGSWRVTRFAVERTGSC